LAESLASRQVIKRRLLKEFHLSDKAKDYPYSLSGGEAQRVALARALALEPEILCFDEPTSALDPRLKNQVASLLLELKKEGHTLLVVTHEIAFAQAVGDHIVFLEDGMIKEKEERLILTAPKSDALKAFLSANQKEETMKEDPKTKKKELDKLYEALVSIDSIEDCRYFLDDLLSVEELNSLSSRLHAAKLLISGETYQDVTKETKISSATLARVSRCVKEGKGYNRVLRKTK
jgi:TrpR-related protein YerC/YecD